MKKTTPQTIDPAALSSMPVADIPISDLNAAPYNPRKIKPSKLAALKATITKFGMVQPAVVNRRTGMTVVGGHQRIKVWQALGHATMPCVVVDLPPEKEKALNLALNAGYGEFDEAALAGLLADLSDMPEFDLATTGLDDLELSALLPGPQSQKLDYMKKDLEPYKRTHVLLSFAPERLADIAPHLEKILALGGVEYEQGSN